MSEVVRLYAVRRLAGFAIPSDGNSGNATSIQGVPVDPTAPATGDGWIFDGTKWGPGAPSGDAISLRSIPIVAGTPNVGDMYLVESDGAGGKRIAHRKPTLDDIGPAYTINSFAIGGGNTREVMQSLVNPTFTASFSATPDLLTIVRVGDPTPLDVTSTPTAFSYPGTFTLNAYGSTQTFTLSATKSGVTKTTSLTVTAYLKHYYGSAAIPGALDEAFIEGLPSSVVTSVRARNQNGAGQYLWDAYPSRFGAASFTIGGFSGGGIVVASAVSVTNAYGYTETYDLARSTNVVSAGPPAVVWGIN